jgi:predicted regulator of Ras-like GTPase activity (Roadblock/LC7/MglB family)
VDPARHQTPDLNRLIADFAERVPDVQHALVISAEGVPLAGSDAMQPEDADRISAIVSGLMSLAHSAARIFDGGAITQALVIMGRGTLVIMAIDDAASLAVLTTAADLDLVAYEMTMLVEQAGQPNTPGSV